MSDGSINRHETILKFSFPAAFREFEKSERQSISLPLMESVFRSIGAKLRHFYSHCLTDDNGLMCVTEKQFDIRLKTRDFMLGEVESKDFQKQENADYWRAVRF